MKAQSPKRSRLQKALSRGFKVDIPQVQKTQWSIFGKYQRGLGTLYTLYIPTLANRITNESIDIFSHQLSSQLRTIELAPKGIYLSIYIAVQYIGNDRRSADNVAHTFAKSVWGSIKDISDRIQLKFGTLQGPGKVLSINTITEDTLQDGCEAVILLDDDIVMEECCLSTLIDEYQISHKPVALGAQKVATPASTFWSRLLFSAKKHTQPATQYPHACCMIVSMNVMNSGIPIHYSSDDGFICFELLEPNTTNPLHRLRLIESAVVHHTVGGHSREIRTRIRRMILNHYQFLSEYDVEKSRYYVRDLLFHGFWPIGHFDKRTGVTSGVLRWSIKMIYFLMFTKVGVELLLRGICQKPITNIKWGSDGI